MRPQQSGNAGKVFSLPNTHGDIFATTDASGTQTSTHQYDPFGVVLSSTKANNADAKTDFGWVGQHEKFTETDMVLTPINMGARLYIPRLGRFTSVDPQEGGNENNYSYPPDPVNDFDLDGNAGINWKSAIHTVTKIASVGSFIPGPTGMVSGAIAAVGYASQGNWGAAGMAAAGSLTFGLARYGRAIGTVATLSKNIGVNSKYFGNTSALPNIVRNRVPAFSGALNAKNRTANLGWSIGKKPAGYGI
jgi:RHS repeat-associated protein